MLDQLHSIFSKNPQAVERVWWIALMLNVFSITGIAGLGFWISSDYWSIFGNNYLAVDQFANAMKLHFQPKPTADITLWLRTLISLAWLSYSFLVATAFFANVTVGPVVRALAILFPLGIGIFAPPWLSSDVYAYVAYGRMNVFYGINPYETSPMALNAYGDAVAPFLFWDVISVYGPLWTLLAVAAVNLLQTFPLLVQVIGLKMIIAAAHIALLIGVAYLAELLAPRLKNAAFISIAFSPLFLVEGPASGHNDTLMLALAIWGVVLWERGALRRGSLLLGLAGAVKFISFVIPVWLLASHLYRGHHRWRQVLVLSCIAIAPLLILQSYFSGDFLNPLAALFAHFSPSHGRSMVPNTHLLVPFFLIVGICSFAVITNRLMHWTTAWTLISVVAITMIGPTWPWYLMWGGVFLFAGYSKHLTYAVIPYICLGYFLMWGYSVTS